MGRAARGESYLEEEALFYGSDFDSVDDGYVVGSDGAKYWMGEEKYPHREDGPAVVGADGTEIWYQAGKIHRQDGPAIIRPEGLEAGLPLEEWYYEGQRHREGGPARVYKNGKEEYYQGGKLHRKGGPAILRPRKVAEEEAAPLEEWIREGEYHREGLPAVIWPNKKQEWWLDGMRHRRGAPAIVVPKEAIMGMREVAEEWYTMGQLHRIGGPARIYHNGNEEWYREGQRQDLSSNHERDVIPDITNQYDWSDAPGLLSRIKARIAAARKS